MSDDGSIVTGVAQGRLVAGRPWALRWWTEAGGMVEATEYLKANGMDPGKPNKIYNVTARSRPTATTSPSPRSWPSSCSRSVRALIHRAP